MSTTPPAPRRALTEDSPAGSSTRPTPAGQGAPVPDASGAPTPGDGYLSHKQIMGVMGGLMAGMFLAALDQSIVGVALPRITS
ncbi:MAG TPA: MFS transporter, partial [Microlunatus sp.]|nr:MFS transporter [Microlunatus sp.]